MRSPVGLAGQVRPRRRSRGGSPPAPRSRTAAAEINYYCLKATKLRKESFKKEGSSEKYILKNKITESKKKWRLSPLLIAEWNKHIYVFQVNED